MKASASQKHKKSVSLKVSQKGKQAGKTNTSQKNHLNKHTVPRPAKDAGRRFLGFAERCRRMSANPIRVLQQKPELNTNEQTTHLSAAITKWKDLNLSTQFERCQRELGPDLQSVAQLLSQHSRVADTLLRHLQRPDTTAPAVDPHLTAEALSIAAAQQNASESSNQDGDEDKADGETQNNLIAAVPPKTVQNDLSLTSSALIPKDANFFSSKNEDKYPKFLGEKDEIPKALEPVLELIVAFATDIPQHFYEHHFYRLLPHVVTHAYVKQPQQIEMVFTCITSLTVILRKFIQKDSYKLYTDCFANLFSSRCPWYITDMAAQTLAFLVRKLEDKELFLYRVFKRLKTDPSQSKGLGKLLTAVMKHNSLNRVHRVTPEILRIVLNIMALKSVPTRHAVEALVLGLKGLAFFVTNKNLQTKWQELWSQDVGLVWEPVWRQLLATAASAEAKVHFAQKDVVQDEEDSDAKEELNDMKELKKLHKMEVNDYSSDEESSEDEKPQGDVSAVSANVLTDLQTQLHSILSIVRFLISFKRGVLLPDVKVAFDQLQPIIAAHSSPLIGDCLADILSDLLKSSNHQACTDQYDASNPLQVRRNRIISALFDSSFPRSVVFSFAKNAIDLPHFEKEILPKLLGYMSREVATSCQEDEGVALDVLSLMMDIILHHQPPVKSGDLLNQWERYSICFDQYTISRLNSGSESVPSSVPELIEHSINQGLKDDLSNCELLLTAIMCLPHVSPIDHQDVTPSLAWILNDALEMLAVKPRTVLQAESLTPKAQSGKKKRSSHNEESVEVDTPELDLNVDCSLDSSTYQLLFLVNIVVETMAHSLTRQDFLSTLNGMNVVNILEEHPQLRENEHLLRAIDIYLTIASTVPDDGENSADEDDDDDSDIPVPSPITDDMFDLVYRLLAPSLASPRAQTRLLVTHILSLFPLQLPPPPQGVTRQEGLFTIMNKVENVALTALNYNERLRLMANIDAEHVDNHSPVSGACMHAPILFAIGQLYVNLNPIWGYSVNYLAGFAEKLSQDQFWPLWLAKLKLVSHSAVLQMTDHEEVEAPIFGAKASLTRVHDYLTSHETHARLSKRVDHINARNLLWKTMHKFPQMCEAKGRDIVSSFFEFMELEMLTTDFSIAPTENLEKSNRRDAEDEEDDSQEDDEEAEDDTEAVDEKKTKRKSGKLVLNSLCNYLTLFSRFNNLKCVYLAPDLEKIFMDLLVHPSKRVQHLALVCIFAYKHKGVLPYHDNLLRIHSDTSFKSGVTAFRIDNSGEESSSVAESHRFKLMPLYIRLLYGKMQTNTGKNTSGRSKTSARKATVMRLLAGITEQESDCLLDLVFEILVPHLQGTCLEVVERSFNNLDITKAVPLKRMMGIMGTLDCILNYLGNLLPSKKPYFLKVILLLLSQATVLRDLTPEVHPSHQGMLKKVKNKAMHALLKFLSTFDDYMWTSIETEAVFAAAVWPALKKLPTESVNNIHPVLKIFKKWSENERYHPLFVKHHPEDKSLTPLPFIFSLVTQPKCRITVINYVLNIVDNLMGSDESLNRLQEPEETTGGNKRRKHFTKVKRVNKTSDNANESTEFDPSLEFIACDNVLPVIEPKIRIADSTKPTYGTKILLPHTYLLTKCMQTVVHQFTSKTGADHQQLKILCQITRFVMDGAEGDKLLQLIIPILVKRKTTDSEVVAHLLLTCAHLLPVSEQCEALCLKMVPLFQSVVGQVARTELCNVFTSVAKEQPRLSWLALTMHSLNSWEKGHADSLDVSRRLKAYQQLTAKLEAEDSEFDEVLFVYVVYQCFHDINVITDITIQECALRCFSQLLRSLVKFRDSHSSKFKEMIALSLSKIKQGCKAHPDPVHCIFMKLFGVSVQAAGEHIKALNDLTNILTYDAKADFFGNISHLTTTRRAKALSKLMHAIKNGSLVLKADTLEGFIWPLVSRYLTHPRYTDEPGLLSSSIDCIGVIAAKLPWATYLQTLKFFLRILMGKANNPRIGLKVVSIILDAFHEDVSGLVLLEKKGKKFVKVQGSTPAPANEVKNTEDDNQESGEQEPVEVVLPDTATTHKDAHNRKVYRALVQEIIPGLKKVFESRSKNASNHKLNKANRADSDEIKKIPLALPLVKLLKKFPSRVLDANLGNVFYHLITFLQSHVPYIRRDAREMMVKVLHEVGSKYLPGLVKDLKANLGLGFQRHVLVYTVKALLVGTTSILKPEDVGKSAGVIMNICVGELFTHKDVDDKNDDREDKEEQVEEAKGEKSYAILAVLGQLVKVQKIEEVFVPLKNVLDNTHRKSVVVLVQKCLENFMTGLEKNKTITLREKSILIYGILTDRITQLKNEAKEAAPSKDVWNIPDRMLLEPEPKRIKLSAKTASNTNSYIFVEFAFSLLNKLLRSDSFRADVAEHCGFLDPYIALLGEFIHSQNPEVTVACLKCFTLLLNFPLPALKSKMDYLAAQMFVLLNKFSSTELEKGNMYNLVQLTFRCLAVTINKVSYYSMRDDHMRVLLIYVKENLTHHTHQHTVFSLLQAIVARRLQTPELPAIMDEVRKMIITDTTVTVLDQARSVYFEYLTNYPVVVKKFAATFRYFIENVDYPTVQGRVSVCLMIDNMITNVPAKYLLEKNVKSLWIKLMLCLIQEENDQCRRHQQFSLQRLFAHYGDQQFLVKECLLLMKDDPNNSRTANATNVQLGALSLLAFMGNPEEIYPKTFLTEVLPRVVSLLHPSRFQPIPVIEDDATVISQQLCIDKSLLSLLKLFQKLYLTYHSDSKWSDLADESVWAHVVEYLLYSEFEVRLFSGSLLGKFFASYPVEEAACPCVAQTTSQVRSLVMDLIEQFGCAAPVLEEKFKELCLMSVRNLLYLLRHSAKVPLIHISALRDSENLSNSEYNRLQLSISQVREHGQVGVSAAWVMSLIAKIAYEDLNKEKTLRREALLNLIAGVVLVLGDSLSSSGPALTFLMTHLSREVKLSAKDEQFADQVREVVEMVQERLGWDRYSELLQQAEASLAVRKLARRSNKKERLIRNPQLAEEEKHKRNIANKLSKKRKLKEGKPIAKRRRVEY